jgi:hypothetical protein
MSIRHHSGRLVVGLAASLLVLTSALSTVASAGVVTTSSVLSAAKSAIQKHSAVHLEINVTSGSSSAEKVVQDAATSTGIETITEGTASATVKVMPSYAYMSGNSSGLTTILGLTSAQAKKVGKDWVSMKSGASQYSDLEKVVTLSSVSSVFPAAKGTKLSTSVVNGTKVFVLSWTTAATSSAPKISSILTISAVGANLPIKETATASGEKEIITLSKWDEHVSVSAPSAASTITYAKVTG